MTEELRKIYDRLRLKDDSDEAVIISDPIINFNTTNLPSFYLAAKILSPKKKHVPSMISLMKQVWTITGAVNGMLMGENKALFTFSKRADRLLTDLLWC